MIFSLVLMSVFMANANIFDRVEQMLVASMLFYYYMNCYAYRVFSKKFLVTFYCLGLCLPTCLQYISFLQKFVKSLLPTPGR